MSAPYATASDVVTQDRDVVLANFVRDRSFCVAGSVYHDTGDSTVIVEGVDIDSFFSDVASLGWDVIVQATVRRPAA